MVIGARLVLAPRCRAAATYLVGQVGGHINTGVRQGGTPV